MKETKNSTSRGQIIALRQRDASAGLRTDYWSSDDRDTLQKMFDDGTGITEMALFFHRSETAIRPLAKLSIAIKIADTSD